MIGIAVLLLTLAVAGVACTEVCARTFDRRQAEHEERRRRLLRELRRQERQP